MKKLFGGKFAFGIYFSALAGVAAIAAIDCAREALRSFDSHPYPTYRLIGYDERTKKSEE